MGNTFKAFYLLYPHVVQNTYNAPVEVSRVIYNLSPDLSDVWLPSKDNAPDNQKMYYPPDGDYQEIQPM